MDEIYKMLVLSTAHVTKETADLLDLDEIEGLVVYDKGGYGWFIVVTDYDDDTTNIPDDLEKILAYAKSKGCDWLALDRDGEINNNLPTYVWEKED